MGLDLEVGVFAKSRHGPRPQRPGVRELRGRHSGAGPWLAL